MYKLGSVVCTANFEEPAFRLSRQSHALHQALFRNLREFDPGLENVTETDASSGLAHWSLLLNLPGVMLSVRVQGLETTFLNPRNEVPSRADGFLANVESGLAEILPEARILARDFVFNAHFELAPGEYDNLTAPFLGEPPQGLGVRLAQGASFYFQAPGVRADSSLILDRSVVIEGGLYFQVRSRFKAEDTDLASSCSSFRWLLENVIGATNLGGAF